MVTLPGTRRFSFRPVWPQLLISGDAIYVPLSSRPTRTGRAYDQDGERGVETWRKLLDRVIADHMLICGTHFPWRAWAGSRIERRRLCFDFCSGVRPVQTCPRGQFQVFSGSS